MSSVTISDSAAELIMAKLKQPAILSMKKEDSILSLHWAQRVYSTDASGNRREYGPMFHFWWIDPQMIKDDDYLLLPLPDGSEIALAGGEFFRAGSHVIDVKDGKLTLVGAP